MRYPQLSFARVIVLLALGGLFSGNGLSAAEPVNTRMASTQGTESGKKLKRVEVGVEARWRGGFRDNLDFRPTDDFDYSVGQRVRIHLLLRVHPHLNFLVVGQDVWLFGAENDKVIHNLATNLHEVYLVWKPRGNERWELCAGRQEFAYGHERLVGAFGWDNVGRSFDAVRLRYRHAAWTSDFFWARLVDIRRAGAPHRPGNRDLYGVYLTRAPEGSVARMEFYGFFFHDGLRMEGELSTVPDTTRIFTVGFRRAWAPATGPRYEVENAWQFGERGPNHHRAVAVVASAGYAWGGRLRPSLTFEYDFAGGDKNPTDGRSSEFHNLFPTNHLHYGYADLVGLRNLHDFRLTATIQVHPKIILQVDYHRFLLARRRGPWKNAGGRIMGFDPLGEAGRDLGQEFDFTARISLGEHLSFLAGYSVFLPGRFAIRTRGRETHHFGYIQTALRF